MNFSEKFNSDPKQTPGAILSRETNGSISLPFSYPKWAISLRQTVLISCQSFFSRFCFHLKAWLLSNGLLMF